MIGLIIAGLSAFSCLYSTKYMEDKHGQAGYYANLLLFMSGMLGVIFSSNLLQFYLFWELMLIPSYFLISFWGAAKRALTIGFKYFIFTHIGAVCMLLGILSIGAYTGTFDLVLLPERFDMIPLNMVMLIFALLLIGFSVKMATFPLHTWLPDAHAEAPAPISAMLSGAMIKCGAYAMIRIFLSMFSSTMLQTSDYLAIIGIVTIRFIMVDETEKNMLETERQPSSSPISILNDKVSLHTATGISKCVPIVESTREKLVKGLCAMIL